MNKTRDFSLRYAQKVFSIDPSFSALGGLGWSIINLDAEMFDGNKQKPYLHRCGLITPFSSDSNLISMKDLCSNLIDVWRNDSGYSEEPMVVVVELPVIYPNLHISPSSIRDLIMFSGMIAQIFKPRLLVTPTPNEWKGNQPKSVTEKMVLDSLDFLGKRALARDLDYVALDKRHNIFDAIGLGLYAANVFKGRKSPPRMSHAVKAE